MRTTNVMEDPFFTPILYQIESRISAADREALARKLAVNDSQVRSILIKVRKAATGGTPQVPNASERDQLLFGLYESLVNLPAELGVKDGGGEVQELPTADWIMALTTVEDSIRRRSSGPCSREYLQFLQGFIPAA